MTTTRTRPRGIEHIGLTVPDMAAAVSFLEEAFGASVLYAMNTSEEEPLGGPAMSALNGMSEETRMREVRMVRLHNGPNLELFELTKTGRAQATAVDDVGLNHFAVLCDDLAAVSARAEAAGGTPFDGPQLMQKFEAGEGNVNRYIRAPWGTLIELVQMPNPGKEASNRWFPSEA